MDVAGTERIKAGMAFEAARRTPPDGFPRFPDIAAGRYVDPDFLKLERARMWRRPWVYAAHEGQVRNVGAWILWKATGSPILIVRGRDNVVRAFYNTCQHRGAPLVQADKGEARGFVCPYHGWAYALDGKLLNMRDRRDFVDLDLTCRSLVQLRCESFGRWIFVNQDPEAGPLLDYLGPVTGELEQFQPWDLTLVDSRSYDVASNVKVLLDAFLEVYHLESIHQDTVNRFLDHRGTHITLWENGHSRMVTPNRRPDWVDPGTLGMPDIVTVSEIPRFHNVSYHIYPNIVMPAASTGMPMLTFWPTSDKTMRIDCHWFSPPYGEEGRHALWDKRIANFERILFEDTQFAPTIQASMESPGFRSIPLNYQERRIYHWHEELDRRIGLNQVPPDLRVTPMLEPFVNAA